MTWPIRYLVFLCLLATVWSYAQKRSTSKYDEDNSKKDIDVTTSSFHSSRNHSTTHGETSDPPANESQIHKVVLCHEPKFFKEHQCGKNQNLKIDPNLTTLHISRIPHMDQWIHIDVIPTESALSSGTAMKIKHAMIQLSDSQDRIIGRIAEQIPCTQKRHPRYLEGNGEMAQLYQNPGPQGILVIECPMNDNLSYNSPPTVGIFSFMETPVKAFYVNIRLTREEAEYIFNSQTKPNEFSVTTVLADDQQLCYVQRTDRVHIEALRLRRNDHIPNIEVPWKCHQVLPEFEAEPHSLVSENIEFGKDSGFRPKINIPRVSNPSWMDDIVKYNLDLFDLDAEGLSPAEREAEAARNEVTNETDAIHQNVPLIFINGNELVADIDNIARNRKFDQDDEQCDDNVRKLKPEDAKRKIANIYLECAYSRKCIAEPVDCLPDTSCDFIVSWGKEDDYMVFGVIADKVTYVAVGLSHDDKMGNDSVTECNRENNLVVGYTSWNYERGQERGNTRLRSCKCMKDFNAELVHDSLIYCSWKRPIRTEIKGHTFDMNKPLHILLARGYTSFTGVFGGVEKHERTMVLQPGEVFNKYLGKSPFQYYLARLHGLFLLATWTVFIPLATFASRYLKGTFVTSRIYGFSVWYGLHLIFVTIGIIITFIASIAPLIFNNYDKSKQEIRQSWHFILGIFMCLLIVVQLGLAYLRLELFTDVSTLQRLKFLHGTCGHLLMISGHACILTSCYIKDGMPCSILFSYLLYIVMCIIIHLFMSYQICYSDFIRGRKTSRVYDVFIVDRDKNHDQPRKPRHRKTATLTAEANRRKRLTLDDVDIDNVESGAIINPKLSRPFSKMDHSVQQSLEKGEEEPVRTE